MNLIIIIDARWMRRDGTISITIRVYTSGWDTECDTTGIPYTGTRLGVKSITWHYGTVNSCSWAIAVTRGSFAGALLPTVIGSLA